MKRLKMIGGWIILAAVGLSTAAFFGIKKWRGYGEVQVGFQWVGQPIEITNPPEGKLLLDGNSVPVQDFWGSRILTIRLAAGRSYPIMFSHPWLLSQTSAVRVAKGRIHPVVFPIELRPITLVLLTPSTGTVVEMDGERRTVANNGTVTITGLKAGSAHALRSSCEGYRAVNRQIVLTGDLTTVQTNDLRMAPLCGDIKAHFRLADVDAADRDWLLQNSSMLVSVVLGGNAYSSTIGQSLLITNQRPGILEAKVNSDDYLCDAAQLIARVTDAATTICEVVMRPKSAVVLFNANFQVPLQVTDESGILAERQNDGFRVRPGLRTLRVSATGFEDFRVTNAFRPRREHSIEILLVRRGQNTYEQARAAFSSLIEATNLSKVIAFKPSKWRQINEQRDVLEREAGTLSSDLVAVSRAYAELTVQLRQAFEDSIQVEKRYRLLKLSLEDIDHALASGSRTASQAQRELDTCLEVARHQEGLTDLVQSDLSALTDKIAEKAKQEQGQALQSEIKALINRRQYDQAAAKIYFFVDQFGTKDISVTIEDLFRRYTPAVTSEVSALLKRKRVAEARARLDAFGVLFKDREEYANLETAVLSVEHPENMAILQFKNTTPAVATVFSTVISTAFVSAQTFDIYVDSKKVVTVPAFRTWMKDVPVVPGQHSYSVEYRDAGLVTSKQIMTAAQGNVSVQKGEKKRIDFAVPQMPPPSGTSWPVHINTQ